LRLRFPKRRAANGLRWSDDAALAMVHGEWRDGRWSIVEGARPVAHPRWRSRQRAAGAGNCSRAFDRAKPRPCRGPEIPNPNGGRRNAWPKKREYTGPTWAAVPSRRLEVPNRRGLDIHVRLDVVQAHVRASPRQDALILP